MKTGGGPTIAGVVTHETPTPWRGGVPMKVPLGSPNEGIIAFYPYRPAVDRKSKIYRKSIAGMSLAGMSLLACNVYSAGCFLRVCAVACGMCSRLLNVR